MSPDSPSTGLPGKIPQRHYSEVRLDSEHRFAVAFDPEMEDPITRAYMTLRGHTLDRNLVELMLALSAPGGAVVDAGAFLGTFSLAAAALGRRVLAVEASSHNATLLRYSASKNGFPDLVALHAAAGDGFGTVSFHSDGPYGRVTEAGDGTEPVPVVRLGPVLQHLGWEKADFIKIDVEGSEIPCLNGMQEFLSRSDAPPILFESNVYGLRGFGYEPSDLLGRVQELGYTSYLVADAEKRLIRTAPDELQATTVVNYLAFKRSAPAIEGWTVEDGMSLEERVLRITTEAGWRDPLHRAAIGGSLATAASEILENPLVARALDQLRGDSDPTVSSAAGGSAGRGTPPRPASQVLSQPEVTAAVEAVLRESADGMNQALLADNLYLSQVLAAVPPPASPASSEASPVEHGVNQVTELLDRVDRLLDGPVRPDHYRICPVALPQGPRFDIVVDTEFGDPITAAYLAGAGPVVDQEMVDLALRLLKPGDVFVDLGTFVGTFSLPAAAIGCHVLSVDASRPNVQLLRASVARNGFWNMTVIHVAVAEESGYVEFCQNGPVGHVATEGIELPTVSVPAARVDDLLHLLGWDRVKLMKIDVEGFEIKALRGMAERLHSVNAPPILYESNGHTLEFFGSGPADLLGELESYGYSNYLVLPGRLIRTRPEELQPSTVVNYLAVKGRPPILPGWRIEERLSEEERVQLIVREVGYRSQDHSAYVAKALAKAEPAFLRAEGMDEVIEMLLNDPSEVVRREAKKVGRV